MPPHNYDPEKDHPDELGGRGESNNCGISSESWSSSGSSEDDIGDGPGGGY